MSPLNIRLDGGPNANGSSIVRFPKLSQGAPYSCSLRIRLEDDSYRQWTASQIVWRMKLRPADRTDLMVLKMSEGNFAIDGNTLTFKVKATDWKNVKLPQSTNHMEMDVPFSFVIEFQDENGVVTERFAQGSGLIGVDLAF